jgi:hypothetical protein
VARAEVESERPAVTQRGPWVRFEGGRAAGLAGGRYYRAGRGGGTSDIDPKNPRRGDEQVRQLEYLKGTAKAPIGWPAPAIVANVRPRRP